MDDALEYNNRERLKAFGNTPASSMTKRETMSIEILQSIISSQLYENNDIDTCVERAISIADKLIEKLNENS
jgi:hypothetical protein